MTKPIKPYDTTPCLDYLLYIKNINKCLVKSAGKTLVKVAKSNTGKAVFNSIKDQVIDTGGQLETDPLRREESLQN